MRAPKLSSSDSPRGAGRRRSELRRRATSPAGDSLIEVVIAALLIGLIAAGVLSAFTGASRASADQRHHSQADGLAEQDEDRLRGLQVADLVNFSNAGPSPGCTNTYSTPTSQVESCPRDGTTYTLTTTAQYINDPSANSGCSAVSSSDYLQTRSAVTWGAIGNRTPVSEESIITPPQSTLSGPSGGSLVAQVLDQQSSPAPGMTVTAVGPGSTGTTTAATTNSSGCAVFPTLATGAYTVTVSAPAGSPAYVDVNGNTTAEQSATLVAGTPGRLVFQYAAAGSITASFSSQWGGATHVSSADTFTIANSAMSPTARVFGTPGMRQASIATPTSVFPFTTPYSAYAGSCAADDPSVVSQGAVTDTPVSVVRGSPSPTPTLPIPALIIQSYTGPNGSSTYSTTPQDVTVTDTGCNVTRRYSAAAVTAPGSAGGVLVDPGQPYGTYNVCVDGYATANTMVHVITSAPVVSANPAGTTVSLYANSQTAQWGPCP